MKKSVMVTIAIMIVVLFSSCNKKNEEKINDGNIPVTVTNERLAPSPDSKTYFVTKKNTPVYDFKHKLVGYADEGIYSGVERNDSIYCTENYLLTFSYKFKDESVFLSSTKVQFVSVFPKGFLTEGRR